MGFTHTTTGATDRSTIVRGDVAIISGTWRSKGVASGTILTGGSVILAHDVTVGSAPVSGSAMTGSAVVLSAKNKAGDQSAKNGTIMVRSLDTSNEISGDWWAIARI